MRASIVTFVSYIAAAAAAAVDATRPRSLNLSEIFVPIEYNGTAVIEKRQPGGVIICQDINWQGCGYAKQPWDLCIRLDSPWWRTISSIGPDEYNAIVAYEDYNCGSSSTLAIFNPGYPSLVPAGWNDRIGSFRVLQIGGPKCIYQNDFERSWLAQSTTCRSCCRGCTRGSNSCCPEGIFC